MKRQFKKASRAILVAGPAARRSIFRCPNSLPLAPPDESQKKKIKIREGDTVKEVPAYEALVDAIFTYGMKGNARYGGMALDIIRTAEQAHARQARAQNEYWRDYQSVARDAIAELRAKGEAEPEILPPPTTS